ncbi:MAG: conjugal transfer protein [Oxalobacteraceae bacterium]|nr:MAG: conjugal transfer protein [Oxalobacteraceae bacterium]
MIFTIAAAADLARQCAPGVAVETMLSVIHTESRFNSLAIGVNRGGRSKPKPRSYAEAVNTAYALIRAGYNIDLGLGQINSANLRRLNLSIEDAFDPCRSLTAAATVLTANYLRVLPRSQSTQHALATALSMYNTGKEWRGFTNGYVGRVYGSAGTVVPSIAGLPKLAPPSTVLAMNRPSDFGAVARRADPQPAPPVRLPEEGPPAREAPAASVQGVMVFQ